MRQDKPVLLMQVHANMAETDANPQDAFRDKAKIESEVASDLNGII